MASNKITGGGGGGLELVCGRRTLALASALVHQIQQLRTRKRKRIKHKRKAKAILYFTEMIFKLS